MKIHWILKNNNKDLIIFYNGWALDENPFLFLKNSGSYDIVIFYDYRELPNTIEFLHNYNKIFHIGYSFGNYIMNYFLFKNIITKNNGTLYSVNGTTKIISKYYGINPLIFDKTIINIKNYGITIFYKNLFDNNEDYIRFSNYLPDRNINEQLDELNSLYSLYITNINIEPHIDYSIISKNDKIIPHMAQEKFNKYYNIKYKIINSGHFPFYLWNSWEDIIKEFENDR